MKLECDTFYFYPSGEFKTTSKWNAQFDCYECDLEQYSKSIRIFGTRAEIEDAFEKYCKASGLNVDESSNFKVEPKGSYWYNNIKNRFGESEAIRKNKEVEEKLKEYAKHYKNKALIINLI
tara:strand:+ start:56 stop:418 length:363 start_codon:yes stop_codon:yes gene_type:complete